MSALHSLNYNWAKAHPITPGVIAMQAGVTPYFESMPGQGKTSLAGAIAETLGYELLLFIGSIYDPTDFGGIPFPAASEDGKPPAYFDHVCAKFAYRLTRPRTLFLADEITCVPPSKRSPLLTVYSERIIGGHPVHPDTLFMVAGNPPHVAPDASPLEKSLSNRFAHFKWEMDFEQWAEGFSTEDNKFPAPRIPVVPSDWRRFRPQEGRIIESYLRRNSGERTRVPDNDEEVAYPTYRSWTYVRDCLSAAAAVGAPADIQGKLVTACVGQKSSGQYMEFRRTLDLVDPEDVLSGKAEFKFDRKRVDLAAALLAAVVTSMKANWSEERMEAAVALFCRNIGKHAKDLVFTQLKHLLMTKPAHIPRHSAKVMEMVKEFGNTLPGAGK